MANFYEGIMAGGMADADAQERYLNVILRKETRRRAEDWTMEECACWAHQCEELQEPIRRKR